MGSPVGNMVEMEGSQAGSLRHRKSGGATAKLAAPTAGKSRLPGSGPNTVQLRCHTPEQHNGAEAVREDVEILLVRTVFKHHGYTSQFWPN